MPTLSLLPDEAHARADDLSRFRAHLDQVNTDSLRIVTLLGGILMPLFWLMDVWVVPDHLYVTLALRLLVGATAVVILVAIRHRRSIVTRYVSWLGLAYTWLISATISAMCWLHAGFGSPYYAGLNLVVVGAGVLFIWPLRFGSLFCLLLWGSYMLPLPLGLIDIGDSKLFIASQFFLFGTIVITLSAQERRYELELRSFLSAEALQRTKRSLESAYESLKEHDRLKSQFFSNITHELRTPLTMILAPLESLLNGELAALSESQRNYLVPIHANGIRLLKLINDLLDLAKIEEKYLRLRVVPTDLRQLLVEIAEHARPLAARKQIQLHLDIVSSHQDVYVDSDKMERVVVNLLSNALKFSEPGGTVTLRLKRDGELACISVHDDGPGIAQSEQQLIFERFRQADGEVTRKHGGTGIGLSLAKEIVLLHGGTVTVSSRVGHGSTFSVHLRRGREHLSDELLDRRLADDPTVAPRRGDDREPREWTQQLVERSEYRFLDIRHATERRLTERKDESSKATRVLVVEDNMDLLSFISVQLSEQHSVYVAPDGNKGLELALRTRPDIIVTDYMMPRMDGLTLIESLKTDQRTADIPIIMLSAKNRIEDRVKARGAGADVYLSKPFSPSELRTAVDQLLQRRGRQVSLVLREQVRSLEIISAGLAHEIHNPLSSVRTAVFVIAEQLGLAKEAAERASAEELRDTVRRAAERSDRMHALAVKGIDRIRRVVELVRNYAREGYPTELVSIELDTTVRELEPLVSPPTDRNVEVTVELKAPGLAVRCIPAELEQVVRNLWQNALDVVDDGGSVSVRTRRDGACVVLEVEDDGPGIPRDLLGRIFTPFFTTKDPGRGLGLGLAISHQVVSSIGGEIGVESTPGRGSIFRVRLPIGAEERIGTRTGEGSDRPAQA